MTAVSTLTTCARHPEVETALRCQSCDTPICPRCLVQSPVGAKCPACAKVVKSPIYTLNSSQFLRAAGAAIGGGIAMGLVWTFVLLPFTVGFFSIFVGAGLGYVFTRLLEWASGHKRGPVMVWLAVLGIVIAWSMTTVVLPFQVALYGLVAVGVGVYWAYQNLR